MGGRGVLTPLAQRQQLAFLVEEAGGAGARRSRCCAQLGLHPRTLQRWRTGGAGGDRRPEAFHPTPAHALSTAERAGVLAAAHAPEHADLPPAQIVPALADRGIFLASESTFYRVLRDHHQVHHRGRARCPRRLPRPTHTASAPNQVWVWDITYLKTTRAGFFLYLYLIVDLYSRKIVAHEVFEAENSDHSAQLLRRAALAENLAACSSPLLLHGDNGSPLKGGTVLALMQQLGITPSRSRPGVSNDNAFAEAAIRTVKYHPSLDPAGFASLEDARAWALGFKTWYNQEHRHSCLRFVTPAQKHAGLDTAILARRAQTYANAKARCPSRWSRQTRNWTPVTSTSLTPTDDRAIERIHKSAA